MKANVLAMLADVVAETPLSETERDALRALARPFREAAPTATAAAVVKKLEGALADPDVFETKVGPSLGDARKGLRTIRRIVQALGTKVAVGVAEQIDQVCSINSTVSIHEMLDRLRVQKRPPPKPKIPNHDAVAKYVGLLLSAAPGTSAFGDALDRLKEDKTNIRATEMRLIASRVGAQVKEDATRAVTFKRIEREHKIIVDTSKKTRALHGNNAG